MWRKISHNMICDYSGSVALLARVVARLLTFPFNLLRSISYEKLRHTGSGGIQWPCNEVTAPNGTVRMYTDGVFPTTLDKVSVPHRTASFGGPPGNIDLVTGSVLDFRLRDWCSTHKGTVPEAKCKWQGYFQSITILSLRRHARRAISSRHQSWSSYCS